MRICETCGFDRDLPRRVVLLCDGLLSFATYLERQCPDCGHIADGSTIVHGTMTPKPAVQAEDAGTGPEVMP